MSTQRSDVELDVFLQELKPCNLADAERQTMGLRAQRALLPRPPWPSPPCTPALTQRRAQGLSSRRPPVYKLSSLSPGVARQPSQPHSHMPITVWLRQLSLQCSTASHTMSPMSIHPLGSASGRVNRALVLGWSL